MIVSLCQVKQTKRSEELIFNAGPIHWDAMDKGTVRKSGRLHPYNFLSARILDRGDDASLSVRLRELFEQFDKVGGVQEYLNKVNAPEKFIRVEIFVDSNELRDQNLGPEDLSLLSNLDLGIEFWFRKGDS